MIKGLLLAVAIPAAWGAGFFLINRFLPDKKVEQFGYGLGKAVSKFLSFRIGKHYGEKIETMFQKKMRKFTSGFHKGMDSDD